MNLRNIHSGSKEEPVPISISNPTLTPLDTLSVVLLAQQLPSLPNFCGDNIDEDGESFGEWLEHLELVASACHWNDRAKLMNVATRLHGSASRFYRFCTTRQRSTLMDSSLLFVIVSLLFICSQYKAVFFMRGSNVQQRVLMTLPRTYASSFIGPMGVYRKEVEKQEKWENLCLPINLLPD